MSLVTIDGYTLTQIDTIAGLRDNYAVFELDEIQNFALNNTEETKNITGKGGTILNTQKTNKAVSGSGTNGLLSGGLMSVQTGSDETTKNIIVKYFEDSIEVTQANTFTLSKTPVGTEGAEVPYIVVEKADGKKVKLEQATSESTGKYTVSGKTVTFNSGDVEMGDKITAYYDVSIADDKAVQIVNTGDKFSGEVELVVTGLAKNNCGIEAEFQLIVYRADFVGNWNLEIGDNQTVHSFEFTSLKNACSKSKAFWAFTIFNEEDIA